MGDMSTAYTLAMPKPFRLFLLVAGLAAIGLALWSVVADLRASSQGVAVEPNFIRLLLLSLAGGALLSASRYKG